MLGFEYVLFICKDKYICCPLKHVFSILLDWVLDFKGFMCGTVFVYVGRFKNIRNMCVFCFCFCLISYNNIYKYVFYIICNLGCVCGRGGYKEVFAKFKQFFFSTEMMQLQFIIMRVLCEYFVVFTNRHTVFYIVTFKTKLPHTYTLCVFRSLSMSL